MATLNKSKDKSNVLASVIMPVFNAENYVGIAIESILNQTEQNFEFLIFDDGSTDSSWDIIQSYKDPRIQCFKSPVNVGYVVHLNSGIELSKGKYIIRMDADDIAMPSRFEDQINYMEAHPMVGVCGSWVEEFGQKTQIFRFPIGHENIIVEQLFFAPIVHPSVIIRKKILDQFNIRYKEDYLYAEDAEMWTQLARVTKLANIPKVLLKYRAHASSVTATKWKSHQSKLINSIRINQYERLLDRKINAVEESFIGEVLDVNYKNIKLIAAFFNALKTANYQKKIYQPTILHPFLNSLILGQLSSNFQWTFSYLGGLLAFPLFFYRVFFEKRIYVRAFEKTVGKLKKKHEDITNS